MTGWNSTWRGKAWSKDFDTLQKALKNYFKAFIFSFALFLPSAAEASAKAVALF